jgi:hypothetical protein
MEKVTIEQLSKLMDRTVWLKGDMKRIYINDAGWNTKKMSTKAYIWQDKNGNFKVSVNIDCPSQHDNWLESQEEKIRESIETMLERAIFEHENPDKDFNEYHS